MLEARNISDQAIRQSDPDPRRYWHGPEFTFADTLFELRKIDRFDINRGQNSQIPCEIRFHDQEWHHDQSNEESKTHQNDPTFSNSHCFTSDNYAQTWKIGSVIGIFW